MGKFCEIQTRNELADYLQIPRSKLSYILFVEKTENCYSTFEIPKKSGGSRAICAPTEDLKGIQVRLAQALWEYQKDVWKEQKIHPNISHGFEKEKSIITNAKIHRNKRYVLNIDLEDFFNSFHFGRIQGFFEKNRYFLLPHEVAVTIAQIACYMLICNNAMRQYLSKISMNTVSPKDSYSIWRKFAQDGRPYWDTGDFAAWAGWCQGEAAI